MCGRYGFAPGEFRVERRGSARSIKAGWTLPSPGAAFRAEETTDGVLNLDNSAQHFVSGGAIESWVIGHFA